MLQIKRRFTFLEFFLEGEEDRDVRAGRAQSAPAGPEHQSCGSPRLGATPEPEPSQSESDLRDGLDGPIWVPSAGSAGHPVLCKRPCVHVASGRLCVAAAKCNFCHLPHKQVKCLIKRDRHAFHQICKVDFLQVSLQLLERKAQDAGLRGTEALFNILEVELRQLRGELPSNQSSGSNPVLPKGVLRELRKSSFAALAACAAQKCTDGGRIQVYQALHALRQASEVPVHACPV